MKKIFAVLSIVLLVSSCAKNSNYKVEGAIKGVDNGTSVYLQEIDENNRLAPVDTTTVENGKFTFDRGILEQPKMNIISIDGLNGNILFIAENEKIDITANKDSLRSSKIRGGAENEFFKEYFEDVVASSKEKQKLQKEGMSSMQKGDKETVEIIKNEMAAIDKSSVRKRIAMIKDHPSAMVSTVILSDLIGLGIINSDEATEAYDALSQDLKETKKGKEINEFIAKLKAQEVSSKLASIGNKAPEFSAPTPDGKQLALSEVLGKYTIVDFWASWCRPCRLENPNVVKLYNQYHDKGLNIISVSLDRPDEKDRWTQAIKADNMNWYHVSNLLYWQDPIVRQYGITGIPATYLLDDKGVIIDKNLRGDALAEKLDSLLGDS
ncbi:MAG: TlpA disulfide reductase family protein [Leeuwenhoekiella sp.]